MYRRAELLRDGYEDELLADEDKIEELGGADVFIRLNYKSDYLHQYVYRFIDERGKFNEDFKFEFADWIWSLIYFKNKIEDGDLDMKFRPTSVGDDGDKVPFEEIYQQMDSEFDLEALAATPETQKEYEKKLKLIHK